MPEFLWIVLWIVAVGGLIYFTQSPHKPPHRQAVPMTWDETEAWHRFCEASRRSQGGRK